MLKNRTIAMAIPSALLLLAHAVQARAAAPLSAEGVAAAHHALSSESEAPGDFDRALVVQRDGTFFSRDRRVEYAPVSPLSWQRRSPPVASSWGRSMRPLDSSAPSTGIP